MTFNQRNPVHTAPPNSTAYHSIKGDPPSNSVNKASNKGGKIEKFTESWNNLWLFEFGACLLSLIFFFGIFGVLKKYDHRRLADWPYALTINTIVSILSTALGGTLLVPISEGLGQLKWVWFTRPRMLTDMETFDNASRGSMGAFQMLYKLRSLNLATFGSLITILSLALSPFLQQVISFPTRNTIMPLNSSMPRTNYFNDNFNFNALYPIANTTIQGAIFNGLFNPDKSALDVKPSCSTGNCTFSEPYSSLAMCSSCTDVTQLINRTTYFSETVNNETTNVWGYSLPNGLSIEPVHSDFIYTNTMGSDDANGTAYSSYLWPLSVISVISDTNDLDPFPDSEGSPIVGPWAGECVLYLCINTYNATVTNGILEEKILSTHTNESMAPGDQGLFVITQEPCLGNSTYSYSDDINLYTASSCDYSTDTGTFLNIQGWLPSIFTPSDGAVHFDNVIYNNNHSSFALLDNLMSNVATSMTTTIRTSNVGPTALGTTYALETYIEVQWEWMILPACLVFFSIFFLAITVFQSRGIGAWKSSALPLMLTSSLTDPSDKIASLHDIEWIARSRYAILKETPGGNVVLSREID